MRFVEIAQVFAELERTASRLRMLELVADLFRAAGSDGCYRLV